MVFTLILFATTALMSSSDNMAMTSTPGFADKAACMAAGAEAAKTFTSGNTRRVTYVCVPTVK